MVQENIDKNIIGIQNFIVLIGHSMVDPESGSPMMIKCYFKNTRASGKYRQDVIGFQTFKRSFKYAAYPFT